MPSAAASARVCAARAGRASRWAIDGRLSSPSLEKELVRGLTERGVDVVRVGLGPTPMLYYAEVTLEVDGGIQITGSHNPGEYNGFKMVLAACAVLRRRTSRIWPSSPKRVIGKRAQVRSAITRSRTITLTACSRVMPEARFRIGWDAGNGAAGRVIEKLVAQLPGEHHTIFTEIDGNFPNHHPDPTEEKNLADLKTLVAEKSLDFGLAFDGDGDRLGAIDGQGRVVWGDQILSILAEPILREMPGATIIADVKASQALFDRVKALGGTPMMWKTGHSLIKTKMKETDSPLGGRNVRAHLLCTRLLRLRRCAICGASG